MRGQVLANQTPETKHTAHLCRGPEGHESGPSLQGQKAVSLSALSICSQPLSNLGPLALPVGARSQRQTQGPSNGSFLASVWAHKARVGSLFQGTRVSMKSHLEASSLKSGRGPTVWWRGQDRDVGVGSTAGDP